MLEENRDATGFRIRSPFSDEPESGWCPGISEHRIDVHPFVQLHLVPVTGCSGTCSGYLFASQSRMPAFISFAKIPSPANCRAAFAERCQVSP